VNWQETINHPGYFRIYFSTAGDTNFTQLAQITDNQNGGGLHNFTAQVTLPNVTCTDCTLQVIQYMTESDPPSLYFACADLQLVGAGPTGTPAATTAPTPTPNPAGGTAMPATTAAATAGGRGLKSAGDRGAFGCGSTGARGVNASMGFALALPIVGLLRKRKRKE
jgi:hypothetical protein